MARSSASFAPIDSYAAPRVWPRWPLLVALAVLFLGPVVAPLFQATALPGIADSGTLARSLLSSYICPTPAKSYMVAGFPMAVCARCWGATIGLLVAWWAFGRAPRGLVAPVAALVNGFVALPWFVRLALAAWPFALWTAEILGWPAAPLGVLFVNGAHAGFWAGLLFFSLWPGLGVGRALLHK